MKFDYIFHQAANVDTTCCDKEDIFTTNVECFGKLLDKAMKDNSIVIYASSGATYGNSNPPNIVGKNETPTNPYGESKLAMDKLAMEYMGKYKESIIVGLRYFNVYGMGESHKGKMASMIYQLIVRYY